jgi:hypothetical protein
MNLAKVGSMVELSSEMCLNDHVIPPTSPCELGYRGLVFEPFLDNHFSNLLSLTT